MTYLSAVTILLRLLQYWNSRFLMLLKDWLTVVARRCSKSKTGVMMTHFWKMAIVKDQIMGSPFSVRSAG